MGSMFHQILKEKEENKYKKLCRKKCPKCKHLMNKSVELAKWICTRCGNKEKLEE